MDSDIGKSLDSINKLPDSILCHRLSFLSTINAVGNSILSTRWQHLWNFVTSLNFNDYVLFHDRYEFDGRCEMVDLSFMNFVNRVLLLTDVPCLVKFRLRLEEFCNFDIVRTWISALIKRNVTKMDLICNLNNLFEFPRVLFTSKTLANLSLCGDFLLRIPTSVCLPSLKILNLVELQCENEDSAQNLYSGCPILEALYMSGYACDFANAKIWNTSVPTLKCLTVIRVGDSSYRYPLGDQVYKLVVDAPKLEHFHLSDSVTVEFSLVNLSSLLKAKLRTWLNHSWHPPPIMVPVHLSFLEGLQMSSLLMQILIEVEGHVLPTFPNLTHLRLGLDCISCWNQDLLGGFLQCSPKLEVLILEGESPGSGELWGPPPQVPSCLPLHLKEVEIL